jgi:hypothetical protein
MDLSAQTLIARKKPRMNRLGNTIDRKTTVRQKRESEDQILVSPEWLYDAHFNVYNDIHGQLVMAG